MQIIRTEVGLSEDFGFVGFQPPLNSEQISKTRYADLPTGISFVLVSTRDRHLPGAYTEFIYKIHEATDPEITIETAAKAIGHFICCGEEVCVMPASELRQINKGELFF